jgi:hypothetical protein
MHPSVHFFPPKSVHFYTAVDKKKLYPLLEDGQIDREPLNRRLKRAGRILIVSSLTTEPREAYDLYKSRNLVEDHNARVQEPDPGG